MVKHINIYLSLNSLDPSVKSNLEHLPHGMTNKSSLPVTTWVDRFVQLVSMISLHESGEKAGIPSVATVVPTPIANKAVERTPLLNNMMVMDSG